MTGWRRVKAVPAPNMTSVVQRRLCGFRETARQAPLDRALDIAAVRHGRTAAGHAPQVCLPLGASCRRRHGPDQSPHHADVRVRAFVRRYRPRLCCKQCWRADPVSFIATGSITVLLYDRYGRKYCSRSNAPAQTPGWQLQDILTRRMCSGRRVRSIDGDPSRRLPHALWSPVRRAARPTGTGEPRLLIPCPRMHGPSCAAWQPTPPGGAFRVAAAGASPPQDRHGAPGQALCPALDLQFPRQGGPGGGRGI